MESSYRGAPQLPRRSSNIPPAGHRHTSPSTAQPSVPRMPTFSHGAPQPHAQSRPTSPSPSLFQRRISPPRDNHPYKDKDVVHSDHGSSCSTCGSDRSTGRRRRHRKNSATTAEEPARRKYDKELDRLSPPPSKKDPSYSTRREEKHRHRSHNNNITEEEDMVTFVVPDRRSSRREERPMESSRRPRHGEDRSTSPPRGRETKHRTSSSASTAANAPLPTEEDITVHVIHHYESTGAKGGGNRGPPTHPPTPPRHQTPPRLPAPSSSYSVPSNREGGGSTPVLQQSFAQYSTSPIPQQQQYAATQQSQYSTPQLQQPQDDGRGGKGLFTEPLASDIPQQPQRRPVAIFQQPIEATPLSAATTPQYAPPVQPQAQQQRSLVVVAPQSEAGTGVMSLGDVGQLIHPESGERTLMLSPYQFQLMTTTLWEQCRIVVSHSILAEGAAPPSSAPLSTANTNRAVQQRNIFNYNTSTAVPSAATSPALDQRSRSIYTPPTPSITAGSNNNNDATGGGGSSSVGNSIFRNEPSHMYMSPVPSSTTYQDTTSPSSSLVYHQNRMAQMEQQSQNANAALSREERRRALLGGERRLTTPPRTNSGPPSSTRTPPPPPHVQLRQAHSPGPVMPHYAPPQWAPPPPSATVPATRTRASPARHHPPQRRPSSTR